MHAKDKKLKDATNAKINKMFDELAAQPFDDVDTNILKGIVRKRFKEDDDDRINAVNFEELDPDRVHRIKRSKRNLPGIANNGSLVWTESDDEDGGELKTSKPIKDNFVVAEGI